MKRQTRSAEVTQVTSHHSGQVRVTVEFHDGGSSNTRHQRQTVVFYTSERDQPRVGQGVYIAIGELPSNKSRVQAIKDDADEDARARVRGDR